MSEEPLPVIRRHVGLLGYEVSVGTDRVKLSANLVACGRRSLGNSPRSAPWATWAKPRRPDAEPMKNFGWDVLRLQ